MRHTQQRGVALLVVLWACTLLAILVGGYAAAARIEGEQTRYQSAQLRVRYAAQAGVMRAIYEVWGHKAAPEGDDEQAPVVPGPPARWIGDGRPFGFDFDRVHVTVTVTNEAGKVDLNTADEAVLRALFLAAGATADRATLLARRIVEWRTPDLPGAATARSAYTQAGLSYGPRRGQMPVLEELQAVLGMDLPLYARVEPAITIWSQRASPEPEFAPALALAALPGMDLASAKKYIQQRDAAPPGTPPPPLPSGVAVGGADGVNAVTIRVEARDESGIRSASSVTVRFARHLPTRVADVPLYLIVRWHDEERA
ncbi:general secretion pathway protein K [Luteibacter sp. Sphag1AF]|uniref:general secretion pathway protein GspK n=1 Tax=Luteibacter sp. Sphag1AF TaxID=2587031 RepID=UPI00160EB00B|nr:type II secretion system protein GspK [Luteibacter sp. Sphag1AF]MBB3227617.1 general secretion pathway protein K [Luteibacter sp. Sphag1AF]